MPSILNSLKLLSDSTRLRLFLLIQREELSVAELQDILGMGQSRISTQLSRLKAEGLASDRKVGKNSLYRAINDKDLREICSRAAEELTESKMDHQALRHVLQKRNNKAKAYFDELAGKFGKQYVPGRSWKALAEALLKILNYKVVADFGAGEGTLSQLLAQRAEKVIAIDNSPKMVEFGSKLAKQHELHNLEYRLGDIENVPIEDESLDLAIFSQALHHANQPSHALAEAYRTLKPGGTLIILDLLQHNFEQARELYFDTWLGFSEVDISQQLQNQGFTNIEVTTVDKESEPPYFQTLLATCNKP